MPKHDFYYRAMEDAVLMTSKTNTIAIKDFAAKNLPILEQKEKELLNKRAKEAQYDEYGLSLFKQKLTI